MSTLKANKNDYIVHQFNGGYYGIVTKAGWNLVYGGDSANEDDYNLEQMNEIYHFESKVKDLLSKEEGTMIVYVMDRNIYPSVKGFKPNLEMIYQKNREVANFKKGTTFQEMAQGIVDKYKDRDLYIVDMCSIRIRGGIFVAKDKNILNRISPITKAALRKLRKKRSKRNRKEN